MLYSSTLRCPRGMWPLACAGREICLRSAMDSLPRIRISYSRQFLTLIRESSSCHLLRTVRRRLFYHWILDRSSCSSRHKLKEESLFGCPIGFAKKLWGPLDEQEVLMLINWCRENLTWGKSSSKTSVAQNGTASQLFFSRMSVVYLTRLIWSLLLSHKTKWTFASLLRRG